MVTFEQVAGLGMRSVVHLNGCSRVVGSRGGVQEKVREYRVNGVLKTWKKEPGRWEVPIIWGMKGWDKLTNGNAGWFHVPESCPLLRTRGAVKGTAGATNVLVNGCDGVRVSDEPNTDR